MNPSIKKANSLFCANRYEEAAHEYEAVISYYAGTALPEVLLVYCNEQLKKIAKLTAAVSVPVTSSETADASGLRICVFTDSRGFHKAKGFDGAMFWERLSARHRLDAFIQPFKWTTLIDFIGLIQDGIVVPSAYDAIVVWAGIVDYSPRPRSQLTDGLYAQATMSLMHVAPSKKYLYARKVNKKQRYLINLLGELDDCNKWLDDGGFDVFYNGEKTGNLYPVSVAERISQYLSRLPNLIFIESCPILPDWDGDFVKGRPRNIAHVVSEYETVTVRHLNQNNILRLSAWTAAQVKAYTVDNLHLTQDGSDEIFTRLSQLLRTKIGEPSESALAHAAMNVIVTAADESFFCALLMLIESVFERAGRTVDCILVFDIGLSPAQAEFLNSINKIQVFSYATADRAKLAALHFDFFDKKTYGFKVYALCFFDKFIKDCGSRPINCLYVDSGIYINRDILPIFDLIDRDHIFCVDHDDCHDFHGDGEFMLLHILAPRLFEEKNGKKFECLSPELLVRAYPKAGFFGYRVNGKYQNLINEHFELSTLTDVLACEKSVTEESERKWYLNNTRVSEYVREKRISYDSLNYIHGRQDQTSLGYLVVKNGVPIQNSRAFNYTASTNVTKDYWLKYFQGQFLRKWPIFEKSISSFLNGHGIQIDTFSNKKVVEEYLRLSWAEHEIKDLATTAIPLPLAAGAESSLTILHRGAMARKEEWKFSGRLLNHKKNIREKDIFILLGNGPSLGEVDLASLKSFSTFGLNAAYRAYERINFWPTYFGCFDSLVCSHHASNFEHLVRSSPIERFFFINYDDQKKPIFTNLEILEHRKFQKLVFHPRTPAEKQRNDIMAVSFNPFIDMLTSGSNAVQCALLMGFRKIILLGCDANYVEIVDGAKQEAKNRNKLFMDKTPDSNPNYWFSDYQQAGDKFNLPNLTGCQLPAWDRLGKTIDFLGVNAEIINCSPISKIEVFKKLSLREAVDYFSSY